MTLILGKHTIKFQYFCCVFLDFIIILVDINVAGFALEICKNGFYIWPKSLSRITAH